MPHYMLYLCLSQGSKKLGTKRRWAMVRDDVLLFFEMKQDAIKQGWLDKKSSGSGTLGRYSIYLYKSLRGYFCHGISIIRAWQSGNYNVQIKA